VSGLPWITRPLSTIASKVAGTSNGPSPGPAIAALKPKLEVLLKQLPVDNFWMFIYNHMPHDACMKSLELLTEKVWPNFTDKINPSSSAKVASA
jgi:hypothetical protein